MFFNNSTFFRRVETRVVNGRDFYSAKVGDTVYASVIDEDFMPIAKMSPVLIKDFVGVYKHHLLGIIFNGEKITKTLLLPIDKINARILLVEVDLFK